MQKVVNSQQAEIKTTGDTFGKGHQLRANYKNESCKDDSWFKIFPNFTWADRKITVFAMLQQQETEFQKPSRYFEVL